MPQVVHLLYYVFALTLSAVGLDNAVLVYIHSFLNNEVNGQQLLNLRPDDLNHLGVHKLGHQELILEAVEHLRNFTFKLLVCCKLPVSSNNFIQRPAT
uniref:SAM domain-containing protein n=1 Tax=Timema shepardi TaxID=629360 RepID=A0A7R9G100_TIMSH|nr:unnamed protein product [Timema shepardi]